MSQPNIIGLVQHGTRNPLQRNAMRRQTTHGMDNGVVRAWPTTEWAGTQGTLAAGQAGHDGAGGTPTGGVGVNASPLSPPLAILPFRQPH